MWLYSALLFLLYYGSSRKWECWIIPHYYWYYFLTKYGFLGYVLAQLGYY
jgi:hypothetical protein